MAKTRGAVKTVGAMMAVTAASKLLGMVRQMLFGSVFAESIEASAFLAASSVSLSLFDILFASAIAGCFIPIFGSAKRESGERAEKFASSFICAVSLAIALASALGIVFSRQVIVLLSPALDEATAVLAARLLRIMLPASLFAGLAHIAAGVLQSYGFFILPAAASSVSNLLLIITLALFRGTPDERSIVVLSTVYTLSWTVQAATLAIPALAKNILRFRKPDIKNPDMRAALKKAPAITAGSLILPCSLLAATFFAPFISAGAISAYNYAYNIFIIVSGILTYGVCNYIFPKLSDVSGEENGEAFRLLTQNGIKSALLLVLPFSAGSIVLSQRIVEIIYLRGNFSQELAADCASLFSVFAVAMPFFALYETLIRAFYSKGIVRLPTVAAVVAVIVCIAANPAFSAITGKSIVSLPLSFLAAQVAAAAVLLFGGAIKRGFFTAGTALDAAKAAFSALVCGVFMYFLDAFVGKIAIKNTFFKNFFVSAIVFLAGSVVYLICIYLFGLLPKGKHKARREDS